MSALSETDRRDLKAAGRARQRALEQAARHTDACRALAVSLAAAGVPETELCVLAGVSRDTVRAWLGKKRVPRPRAATGTP